MSTPRVGRRGRVPLGGLTEDEAAEAATNLTRFFETLLSWSEGAPSPDTANAPNENRVERHKQ